MNVKIKILYTFSCHCIMAWCWPNFKAETCRQMLYDYNAKCFVCLWIFVYACDWFINGNIPYECDIKIYKAVIFSGDFYRYLIVTDGHSLDFSRMGHRSRYLCLSESDRIMEKTALRGASWFKIFIKYHWMIKSMIMGLVEHVARKGRGEVHIGLWWGGN
jgi:hypothetical protein